MALMINGQLNKSSRNKINFGYKIIGDFGASAPEQGSIKCSILSDDGTVIFSTKNDVHEDSLKLVCPNGIKSSKDYVNGITERFRLFVSLAKDKIDKLNGNDRNLSGVVLCLPCQVINNIGCVILNLKDSKGKYLKDVDFGKVKSDLLNSKTIDVDKSNFKFLATEDLIGAVAGVAKILYNSDKLPNGLDFALIMTGGGCGLTEGKRIDDHLLIMDTEWGRIKTQNDEIIEKNGASVPALIRNYFTELSDLGYNFKKEDVDTFVKIGKSQIIMQGPVNIIPKSAKEISKEDHEKAIQKAINKYIDLIRNYFTKLSNLGYNFKKKNVNITPKSTKEISKKDHEKAVQKAITKYIDSVAELCKLEVGRLTNLIVLTGPLAISIRDYIEKHPDNFDNKSLSKLIKEQTLNNLDPGLKILAKNYNFEVKTDIEIADNTVGGAMLLKGEPIASENRSNWFKIPLTALE